MTPTTIVVEETNEVLTVEDTTAPQVITSPAAQGPEGPPGSDAHFTFDQSTPSANWNIAHNLGKMPSVSVVDSAGSLIEGVVDYININTIQVSFGAPFSGKAYLN